MLSLIVFARLIQISVQELASDINDRLYGSTNRGAIDVNVEHTHKNRNARHLFVAQPFWTKQFPWRRDVLDERDEPISGRDDQIFIARCHTYRIAEDRKEHTSELQSLMRISYAVFCLKKKTINNNIHTTEST